MSADRATEAAARWSARLGGLVILASALLVAAEVVGRNLSLGLRLHAFELTNYGFAAATAFGFSFALTQRAHIRIDFLYQLLPLAIRAALDVLALVGLAALASGMAFYGWRVVAESLRLGARPNSTLDIPLALPQALWAVGLTWFALVALVCLLDALARVARGGLRDVHRAAGVARTGSDEAAA